MNIFSPLGIIIYIITGVLITLIVRIYCTKEPVELGLWFLFILIWPLVVLFGIIVFFVTIGEKKL